MANDHLVWPCLAKLNRAGVIAGLVLADGMHACSSPKQVERLRLGNAPVVPPKLSVPDSFQDLKFDCSMALI